MFTQLSQMLTNKKRKEFIDEFIKQVKASPSLIQQVDCIHLLRQTVNDGDSWLSAFLINAGVSIESETTKGWSFFKCANQKDTEYKKKTEDALFIIRYRQFISRNHPSKIISAIFIKNAESINPVPFDSLDIFDSEQIPYTDNQNTINVFLEKLKEVSNVSHYKYTWPIFKMIGLAAQGLHIPIKVSTDNRLLIYIDTDKKIIEDFTISRQQKTGVETKGLTNFHKNHILLAGKITPKELLSNFFHEATHFSICMIYDGNGCPTFQEKNKNKEFIKIVNELFSCNSASLINFPMLNMFCTNYKQADILLKCVEIIPHFVQDLVANKINIDQIKQTQHHILYNLCIFYENNIFYPGIVKYRYLLQNAMNFRKSLIPGALINNASGQDYFLNIKLDNLALFDDTDEENYCDYEPTNSYINCSWRNFAYGAAALLSVAGIFYSGYKARDINLSIPNFSPIFKK